MVTVYDMQCTRPIFIAKNAIWAPCGKCRSCRIARAREWTIRILHEYSGRSGCGAFATMTYDEEHLPENRTLIKEDAVRYMKRLRKRVSPLRIKYYLAGEYGEQYGRPHYHVILLGIDFLNPEHRQAIKDSWTQGIVHIGSVTADSIRYTADYIQKKQYGKDRYPEGVLPPFSLQSQGLGLQYVKENEQQLKSSLKVTYKGVPQGLPRYYKKKLGLTEEAFSEYTEKRREEFETEHLKRVDGQYKDIMLSIIKSRNQADRNIAARQELHKKGTL